MMNRMQKGAPLALAVLLTMPHGANAQMVAPSMATSSKVVTRQLAAPTAKSDEVFGSLAAVRQLPNGSVLVNDQTRKRVLLLDKDLKLVSVVADSTPLTNSAYGARPGGLIPYRGDSTLFVDPASLSMLVIDPNGKLGRTMAAPRPGDVNFLTGGLQGNPGFDAKGRLIYRTREPLRFGAGQAMQAPPDSSALVRFDLAARKLDTVGFFKIAKQNINMTRDDAGNVTGVSVLSNPLPVLDEWVVMSDGTVAFVRGRDYHVDFVGPTGDVSKAEKIPYDWQRMTDDDKTAFLDSSRVALDKLRAANIPAATALASDKPMSATDSASARAKSMVMGGGSGEIAMTMTMRSGPGGVTTTGGMSGNMVVSPITMVPISELPDYKPVFGAGAVRADMDGRIWVRTIPTKATTGGASYDVIDHNGKLVDRVQVPVGTTIAGFGEGGVVYLGFRDEAGIHLQKSVLK
ncbi:MAG: hypothetical protein JWM95_922 [Gemmatimonadetes bacterium]|nr:hypothetical protein [Gemmatimonadota bacterium]